MTEQISMIELFSGIGAQERALRQLGLPYSVTNTCDCDANAVLSYAAMRWDLEKEMETFDFPSQDKMIEELQAKNLGYDFQKGKHSITSRTPITKLKQYYIADKLSNNLGDISKVEKLPYANLVTYSFPCTDVSVAGKGEGMANKCGACGHSWPIDFSNVEEALICPECGATVASSTRSGLLGQVQRLLAKAYEDNELPDMLLMENVKNLVGKKFIGQFETWVNWLDSIGYNTYWKVLNAKHYGIPQNRERVFAISIRKNIDTKGYTFPEQIELKNRLKDVLEHNVDEKYYLPDERIEKILNSTFINKTKEKTEELEPVRLGGLYDSEEGRHQAGAIWDKDAISPTLDTMQGGNRQPFIVDEIKVVGNYMPSNHDASRVVDIDGIAPTVKENHGTVTAIAEPQIIKAGQLDCSFDQSGRVYDPEGIAPTIMSNSHGKTSGGYTSPKIVVSEPNTCLIQPKDRDYKKKNQPREVHIESKDDGVSHALRTNGETMVIEPFVVASRGRNPENPSDRTVGAPTEQRLEPNFSGCTNTLTSVQKDNYICEPQIIQNSHGFNKGSVQDECPAITSSYFQENNYVAEPIIYDDYNSRISADQDAINTLTCNCGASAERNGVKILEPEIIMENITFPVMVRKYDVDCKLLCECLRDHKDASNFSNNDIADTLNIPLTKVEHWFRRDDSFAIPDPDVWPKLKELLNITTNEFDEAIMTFEIKDGVYDKSNRCYHIDGIAPTLTAASANEKIIEPVIIEDFYQSREPRIYTETAPTIRSERTGLKTADGEIEYPCSTRGKQVASAIRASIYKQGSRNLEENVINGLGYEGVIEKEPQLEFVGGLGDKDWAKDGKKLSRNYPQGSRVYSSDGIASALTAQGVGGTGGFSGLYAVEEKIRWRIRKLTDKECWRLMNFTDEDNDRASAFCSASALYKQAGNSICVCCLIALMSSLFIEDGHKAEVWTKYALHFND